MDDFEKQQGILIARMRKVVKLIATLDLLLDHDWDAAAVAARRLSAVQWEGLAIRADVNLPSPTTREMVIDGLWRRVATHNKINRLPGVTALSRTQESRA